MSGDNYCAGESGTLSTVISEDDSGIRMIADSAVEITQKGQKDAVLGAHYLKIGEFSRAASHLSRAFEYYQGEGGILIATIRYHLGMALRFRGHEGDAERAFDLFEDTLADCPWCEAHIGAGWSSEDNNNIYHARYHLREVLAKKTDKDTKRVHEEHAFAAHLALIRVCEDPQEGIQHYSDAKKLQVDSHEPDKWMGYRLHKEGETEHAVRFFIRAKVRAPHDPDLDAWMLELQQQAHKESQDKGSLEWPPDSLPENFEF